MVQYLQAIPCLQLVHLPQLVQGNHSVPDSQAGPSHPEAQHYLLVHVTRTVRADHLAPEDQYPLPALRVHLVLMVLATRLVPQVQRDPADPHLQEFLMVPLALLGPFLRLDRLGLGRPMDLAVHSVRLAQRVLGRLGRLAVRRFHWGPFPLWDQVTHLFLKVKDLNGSKYTERKISAVMGIINNE